MMLELSNSLGVQNTISLDVWSRIYANTISSFQRYNQKGQFTPNFNSDWKGTSYSIKFTSQLTGEVLQKRIDSSNNNFPRSTEFKLYISDELLSNHFKLVKYIQIDCSQLTKDDIYDHLAQVYLGKRKKPDVKQKHFKI